MAKKIPPAPIGSAPGSVFWNSWYEGIRNLINSGTIASSWASLDFAGSNLTDLVTRQHENLQAMQGGVAGEHYHLSAAQVATATTIKAVSGLPTTSDIPANTWAIFRNTVDNKIRLCANYGGTIFSVLLV